MINKKGVTLVELLGAIVILGILTTLVATIFGFFINAQTRVFLSSQANSEGLLVSNVVKNELDDFSPNTYVNCVSENCIVFIKEYEYIYNQDNDMIELITYSEPLTYQISISNSILYLNQEVYDFGDFNLTDDSYIVFEEIDNVIYLTIGLFLSDSDNNVYEFIVSDSFVISEIPG